MKHHRILIIICLSLLPVFSSEARGGRRDVPLFTYGLEWSYSAVFNATWHHNFVTDYGRVNDKGNRFFYENHGEVLAHAGVNIGSYVNLSLYCGYAGTIDDVKMVPVSLRCTWFYGKTNDGHRWFSFIDAGDGILINRINMTDKPSYFGKIGCGYRIRLSRSVKLDFNIAYRLSYAAPDIYDNNVLVPAGDINRNDNYFSSFLMGIGLTF